MKVADFIINHLSEVGIEEVFVVYGAANGDLIDAFTRNDKIKYIAVMHEQAGGFAAEGFSKISGNIGVSIATSGPGGMNFVTPIGNCFYDSVPCLFITGQIKTRYMRPNKEIRQIGFQETDIVDIVSSITKYAKLIDKPEEIKYELEKAISIAKSGRPGPVLLDLPINVQKADIEPNMLQSFKKPQSSNLYNKESIDKSILQFLDELSISQRPGLLVGGGVRMAGASKLIMDFASRLEIPCYPTWNAFDIICSNFMYYGGRIGTYGGPGRNFGIQNTDLLLAIGSRISGRITGGEPDTFVRGAKKYIVDIDLPALEKNNQQIPFDVCIASDAKYFLTRAMELINKSGFKIHDESKSEQTNWLNKVRGWKDKYDPVNEKMFAQSKYIHPYAFLSILSEEMNDEDILVGDCGGNIVALGHSFATKIGQRFITNNGNSPMGFSFAGAIGAWFASNKEQNVICIIGDGGFNMNIQELQTIKNYNVGIKVIIINNHIYGITKAFQETNFEGRSEACGPKGYNPPDFIKICKAYGIKTQVIDDGTNYEEVRDDIRRLLNSGGPIVCDVNCHEYHTYEPKIVGWATPIEDMYPYLPRSEFYNNMIIDPLEISKNPPLPSIDYLKDMME